MLEMGRVVRSILAVKTSDGLFYDVRICGRQLADSRWEGWIEFDPADGSPVLRTPRETTQPRLTDLDYWASGLTPVYLEGALTRAIHAAHLRQMDTEVPDVPFYEGPAPDPHVTGTGTTPPRAPEACESNEFIDVDGAVLDPIALYTKGDDTLRQKLGLLSADHLRRIARGYRLVPRDLELEAFTQLQLAQLIIASVRARCTAEKPYRSMPC
jgi:hypothetical protein